MVEHIIELIGSSVLGSGIVLAIGFIAQKLFEQRLYMSQKLFEQRLNKKQFIFTKLYSDNLDIIKNLYRLLIQSEKGITLLLSQREPSDLKKKEEYKHQTLEAMDELFDYFEENEIVFPKSIVDIMGHLRRKFNEAKQTAAIANMLEDDRGSKAWEDAVTAKDELRKKFATEFPDLKENLKIEFQNKYQLLTE